MRFITYLYVFVPVAIVCKLAELSGLFHVAGRAHLRGRGSVDEYLEQTAGRRRPPRAVIAAIVLAPVVRVALMALPDNSKAIRTRRFMSRFLARRIDGDSLLCNERSRPHIPK